MAEKRDFDQFDQQTGPGGPIFVSKRALNRDLIQRYEFQGFPTLKLIPRNENKHQKSTIQRHLAYLVFRHFSIEAYFWARYPLLFNCQESSVHHNFRKKRCGF